MTGGSARVQKRNLSLLFTLSSNISIFFQITMTVPFMKAYTERLVQVCHQRGAHAMGGMAAFIPSRKDENVNKVAFEKVRQDKEREVADGFDGTWVAHPDLVPFAKGIFMKVRKKLTNDKWLKMYY